MASNRKSLTLEQKIKIVNEMARGVPNVEVCGKYGLSSSTVSTVWKNREKIIRTLNSNISKLKRIRKPTNEEVDRALLEWCRQKRIENVHITGQLLQEKAEEFFKLLHPDSGAPMFSRSWVDRFKRRYNIFSGKLHEETERGSKGTASTSREVVSISGEAASISGETVSISGEFESVFGEAEGDFGELKTTSEDPGSVFAEPLSVFGEIGSISGEAGSISEETGIISAEAGSISGEAGSISGKAESISGEAGSISGEAGSISGETGTFFGETENISIETTEEWLDDFGPQIQTAITPMDKAAEICENYQLKWSSYNAYIHTCIANSLTTEDSYCDVALVTMDGHQIMAHRFVLAYASHYLAKVLKFHPKVTTSLPIMIVLPPEITFKALKILVKYMYSGEATVSKDILKVVLRGGDILRIKGLYRETIEEEHKSKAKHHQSPNPVTTDPARSKDKAPESVTPTTKPMENGKQKKISVIATSTSPPKLALINKPTTEKSCNTVGLRQYTRPKVLNFSMNNFSNADEKGQKRVILNSKALTQKEKPHTITSAEAEALESSNISTDETLVNIKTENFSKSDNLQYLVIKDEPIEWNETDMELVDEKEVFPEVPVKSEISYDSASNDNSNDLYTPLTCELCTATFTIPAEWVRHVQTHTDMLPAKRRRRDSPDEDDENATYPELQCDMCEKAFPTPAEWVRHIQDTHTEFELSLSNRRHPSSKKVEPVSSQGLNDVSKMCFQCNKTFPSHASMVIHKRTHTGEQPFNCKFCAKGFNVKSNLLRHLRTLHNKIINATDLDSTSLDGDSNSN